LLSPSLSILLHAAELGLRAHASVVALQPALFGDLIHTHHALHLAQIGRSHLAHKLWLIPE